MNQPALGRLALARAAQQAFAHLAIAELVVRKHQHFRVAARQFIDRVADGRAGSTIDADDAEARIQQQCRHRAFVEQRAEPLGALRQRVLGALALGGIARQQQDELAAALLDPLHHHLDRKGRAEPRAIRRLALVGAARPQLLVQRFEPALAQARIDLRQREAAQRVALVAQVGERRFVGVDHGAVPIDFEHHLADALERATQRRQRTLGEVLTIDPLDRDEHAIEVTRSDRTPE